MICEELEATTGSAYSGCVGWGGGGHGARGDMVTFRTLATGKAAREMQLQWECG
jgi:hypothetical protein